VRKHSRVSLAVAAAVAAGALGAAGVYAGTAPGTGANGAGVAGTVHAAPRTAAGQAGSPIVDSLKGMKSRAAAAGPWRPQSQAHARLDSRNVPAAGAATVPAALSAKAAPHGASTTKGSAAAGERAGHQPRAQLDAVSAARAQVNGAAQAGSARAHAAPARPARVQAARPRTARAQAAPAAPYLIYDSVLPTAIPANQRVATYADGPFAASAATVAGRGPVLWIDTNGSDPAASALDVEPGDATPAGAAQWVNQKLTAQPNSLAIVYTMLSDWQQVKDNVATLPGWMQSRVRYWIADPTGVPHVVPGANATQWYWGSTYDITTANPGFQVP
jgi:hypothetical protein